MTRRRLAWIRWSMTLFFAVTTAVCLIGLAVFAAHQDATDRERTDDALLAQATSVALGVQVDSDGTVSSAPAPPGTNLQGAVGLRAIGTSPTGVVVAGELSYTEPAARALPTTRTLTRLADAVHDSGRSAFTTTASRDGDRGRWVAVPVPGSGDAVVVLGTTGVSGLDHRAVVVALVALVAVIVLVVAFGGHLLSGLAMRPAVRQTAKQEQFLREAAHELRTPLATVSLIAERGLRDPARAHDALREVDQRLGGITLLVESLLARARADARGTEVPLRRLRLDQLVEVTVDELRADSRVTVTAVPVIVDGNAELLAQAVRNLVENALRHAPESRVVVTVDDRAVTVEDDGRGAAAGGRPGTGTGFRIVEWVADVHRAELTVGLSPLGGVRVSLDFPAAADAH